MVFFCNRSLLSFEKRLIAIDMRTSLFSYIEYEALKYPPGLLFVPFSSDDRLWIWECVVDKG